MRSAIREGKAFGMKHLKSSLNDLRRIFAHTITLRDIAEPLASFDLGQPTPEIRSFMAQHGYDVVGLRERGVVTGYVVCAELMDDKTVGWHRHEFRHDEVLPDGEPLLSAFEALRERRHVFINVLGQIGGIITRGDLQKAPVRLWLFGLVSLLEMQMLRLIRERYPGEAWAGLLTEERVAAARQIFDKRREKKEEIDLSDCLQIVDKAKIFLKDAELLKLTGCPSKQAAEVFFKRVRDLRDALAHANDIINGQWSELGSLITTLEATLERFEKSILSPAETNNRTE